MQLPALACVGGVNAHHLFVATQARVSVYSPLSLVCGMQREMAQIDTSLCFHLVQMRRLEALVALGISVVEDPRIVTQVSEMPAGIEDTSAHLFEDSRIFIFK